MLPDLRVDGSGVLGQSLLGHGNFVSKGSTD